MKMFDGNRSPSPASSNYDFTLRHERVKLFTKVLKQFDANITRTVRAMREVAGSLSSVGQTYHEVAQCVNNTNPHSGVIRPYPSSNVNTNRMVENYGAGLQGAANAFAAEMQSLREGEQFAAFNGAVHQTILKRLHEVITRAKTTTQLGNDVAAALRKAVAAKKVVQKKEAKYVKLGKPLTESKRYATQSEEMRRREQNYESKLRAFDSEYEGLMQRQLYVAGHTMDDFLDANTVYVASMLKVLSCLAPHGADAMVNMVKATEDLGNRLGIAPEEQVGSRLRSFDVNVSVTPGGKGSKCVTPVRSTPGRAASHGSSHNFTSYYQNRRHRGASADRAPPTARALDDGESGEDTVITTADDAAAAKAVVAPSHMWSSPGTSHSRSAALQEPDPTPPPPCPSHPVARFHAGMGSNTAATTVASGAAMTGKAAMPVVPRTGGVVIQKPSKSTVAAAAAKPCATTIPLTASVLERGATQSPGCVPFADGKAPVSQQQPQPQLDMQRTPSTPLAAAVPALALSDARSPPFVVSVSTNSRRTAVLQSQAPLPDLDRARSTEPFDDDCPNGGVSYTARSTLQPLNLLPAMEAAAERPSAVQLNRPSQKFLQPQPHLHVNPLAPLNSNGALAQQPRKSTRRSGTLPAVPAAFAGGYATPRGAAPMAVSAPPPDDATLSSSVDSHFLGESNGTSLQESLSFSYGQANVTGSNAPPNPHHHPQLLQLTTPAAAKSHGSNNWPESETGGVSGRSHALSTSYATDSPAYAPHLRGMELRTWDENDVRACSPA